MKDPKLESIINTDIYLIDQILKGRYIRGEKVLDAGCGNGRNLPWFVENDMDVYAVDQHKESIVFLQEHYPAIANKFGVATLDQLPFESDFFDHIICSAVLHFATSDVHFKAMFAELIRVLKSEGSLFIRMTTDIGLPAKLQHLGHGVYYLKDDTQRFLITKVLLEELLLTHKLEYLEPFKTTVVEEVRSMSTLVLKKRA